MYGTERPRHEQEGRMKRVYEVARDLGLKGTDLASKINSLSLGFTVNNHMTALSESEEDALRRAPERNA